jgi:ubiquinone biosynthesis protein
MGRLLGLLFEITAIFDMRLRPELVLLQKTMVTVEGVARRIDPTHNLWTSAEPVVRRWITRELSPVTRARELADDGARIIRALARQLDPPPKAPIVLVERTPARLLWFALGAAVAGAAFLAMALLRR